MNKIHCTFEEHGKAIQSIFNHAILTSTALYDYQPRSIEQVRDWFSTKKENSFPVFGYENANGTLMGFATYGHFRFFPAYKYTVEHSVYVHSDFRGKGLGSKLMNDIIALAESEDYHVIIGALDQSNATSAALHKKHGFVHCGTIQQAAYKFERWLNLDFYQLILNTPQNPTEK